VTDSQPTHLGRSRRGIGHEGHQEQTRMTPTDDQVTQSSSDGRQFTRGLVALFSLAVGVSAFWPGLPIPARILMFALAAGSAWVIGLTAYHAGRLRADIFRPEALAVGYVAISFLAPLWMLETQGVAVGALSRDIVVSPRTLTILGLSLVAFSVGCLWTFKLSKKGAENLPATNTGRMLVIGRILLLSSLVLTAATAAQGGVATRGLDQLTRTFADSVTVYQAAAALAGLLLVLGARFAQRTSLLGFLDWALVLGTIATLALRGSRGDVVTLILAVLYFYSLRNGSRKVVLISLGACVVLSLLILNYRAAATGNRATATPSSQIIGTFAPAAFTTGATAARIPSQSPYRLGSTYVVALQRQLPSPLANRLFGPPDDTGARQFRSIISFDNKNQGFGFSLPAEGYMNFGLLGAVSLCGLTGLLLSFAYSRRASGWWRTSFYWYPVLITNLPFAMRSDLLGAIKISLYPVIMIAIALALSRSSNLQQEEHRAPVRG